MTVNASHLKRQQPPPQRRPVPLSLELHFAQLLYLNAVVGTTQPRSASCSLGPSCFLHDPVQETWLCL